MEDAEEEGSENAITHLQPMEVRIVMGRIKKRLMLYAPPMIVVGFNISFRLYIYYILFCV